MFISPSDTLIFFFFNFFSFMARQLPENPKTVVGPRYHSFSGDPWYTDALAQYADNPEYVQLLQSNPYMTVNRNETGWDRLINALGFNSGYDKYKSQMETSAKEWQANQIAAFSENEYNSSAASAARDRAAGLNPDLIGVSGNGQASFNESPNPTAPEFNAPSFLDITSAVGNIVSTAMSFASGFMDLKQKGISLGNLAIENSKLLDGLSVDFFSDRVFGRLNPHDENENVHDIIESTVSEYLQSGISQFFPGLSRKMAAKLDKSFARKVSSPDAQSAYFDKVAKLVDSRRNAAKTSSYMNGDDGMFDMEATISVVQPLMELQQKYDLKFAELQNKQAENQESQMEVDAANLEVLKQYPGLEAQSSVSDWQTNKISNEVRKLELQYKKELSSTIRNIVHSLSKTNTWWSNALIMAVYMFSGMSGSVSSGPKGVTRSIGF